MNYPAASSGVSKTTTGKILRPKGRGIHPDGIKKIEIFNIYGLKNICCSMIVCLIMGI
jgi:hypothetical protein